MGRADPAFLRDWFYQQFSWAEVKLYGELIKQPTPEEIEAALNLVQTLSNHGSNVEEQNL